VLATAPRPDEPPLARRVAPGGRGGEIPQVTWRLLLTLTARALAWPPLAVDLLRVAWRFRVRGWWRRPPFLPVPSRDYVRWRMYTAYGDEDAVPPADDVIRYARWAARQR
jgi:hypothetical protein